MAGPIQLTDRSHSLAIRAYGGVNGVPSGSDWRYVGQTWGVAVADADGDGSLDLYVNHHTLAPDEFISGFATETPAHRFLRSKPDNSLNDQHGAVFFDVDQDGDLDLLETRGGGDDKDIDETDQRYWNEVYLNDEGRLVVDNQADELGIAYGPARGRMITPINLDDTVALYLGTQPKDDHTYPSKLVRMSADGTFKDWGVLNANLNGYQWAIGAHFGTDDKADVVRVSNHAIAIGLNASNGVHDLHQIVKRFGTAFVEDVQVADFNGDLKPELLVGFANTSPKLFQFNSAGVLENITLQSGIHHVQAGVVSATTGDFDNDGDIDIATLYSGRGVEISLFLNDGAGQFSHQLHAVAGENGMADEIVSGDFNGDGSIDFLVSSGRGKQPTYPDPSEVANGGYTLLTSKPNDNHYLSIGLEGVESERDGLGARVYVKTADGRTQMLEQDSGVHGNVQDAPWLHFGLGDNESVRSVRVVWADGHEQVVKGVDTDQHIEIVEERGTLLVKRTGSRVDVTASVCP